MKNKLTAFLGFSLLAASLWAHAGNTPAAKAADTEEVAPVFDEAFMQDEDNIKAGSVVWKQCSHCHGAKAYPGKAPKLKPTRMEAGYIYDRVTNGFRKMPPWKAVFSQEQRMQVVAYIKSKQFSP